MQSSFITLGGGGGGGEGFLVDHTVSRGEQRGIRHHQQSVKGGPWRIDYQLTANEGGHKNTMEPLRRGGGKGIRLISS